MAKKKAGRSAKVKVENKSPEKKVLNRAEVEKLAAAEDVVIPNSVPDEKAAAYLAAELDDRLNKKNAEAQKKKAAEDEPEELKAELVHPSQKSEEVISLAEEEVRAALARHIAAGMEFSVKDGVWTMKKGIKEDCGNLAMPLRRIVSCADMVCQRTFVARIEKDGKDKVLMIG